MSSDSSAFSAGPQTLGYLYQARYALYTLLREGKEESAVVIEGLDDIDKHGADGISKLEQLKHHIKGEASLTDTCSDIWKTILIRATYLIKGMWDPDTVEACLISTGIAPKNSAAWFLRDSKDRDVDKAKLLLLTAANKSKSTDTSLIKAFDSFKNLSDKDQDRLLKATIVMDQSPIISDLPALIKPLIKFAGPPSESILQLMYEQLEGWWFNEIVYHLINGSKTPISQMVVHKKLWTITKELQDDNLPVEFSDAVPDFVVDPENDKRVFVSQLRSLKIKTERIKRAIYDYYRCFEQRSSWIRHQLLIDSDIESYDRKLIDAWIGRKLALEEDLAEEKKEEDCITLGRSLLTWVETEASIRIRPKVDDHFITRGSFHMLADLEPPKVYWHPLFLDNLNTTKNK